MRTAIPLVTCSRITLRSPSASSLSISTPRLMGPGCMMMACGLSQEARVLLSPNMLVYSPREGKCRWPWRSCWIRRSITTSASARADLRSWETLAPSAVKPCGHQGRGPDQRDGGAHLRQGVDVRARDAAEEDVAQDRDLAALQGAQVLLHREGVEEALGRVLVRAVARVDDGDVEDLAQVERGARGGVPDHDHVGVQRLDVLGRVAQGLALLRGGARGVEGDHVRAQALRGHVEGHPRARARLQEEVDDRLAAQRGHLLHAARRGSS